MSAPTPTRSPVAAFRASLRASPGRYGLLMAGIAVYGLAIALMVAGERGLGPWDLFQQALSRRLGITVGQANVGVGVALVVALWRAGRFGVGTLLNAVGIGLFLDLFLPFMPPAPPPALGWAMHLAGTLGVGLATGLYLSGRLGSGPRDTLMLVLMGATGGSARTVRTGIEAVVLVAGWALGGTLGLGTVVFALGIGPATQLGLRLFAPELARP